MSEFANKLLPMVKITLRVTTEEFNDEIKSYIDTCATDLQNAGILSYYFDASRLDWEADPQILQAVRWYCLSVFGLYNTDMEKYAAAYASLKATLATQNKYHRDYSQPSGPEENQQLEEIKTKLEELIKASKSQSEKIESLDTAVKENADSLANKLDKTTEANKIYGTDSEGNQATLPVDTFAKRKAHNPNFYTALGYGATPEETTFIMSGAATPNSIVYRDGSANFKVKNPTDNAHPTPKGYVDGLVTPISERQTTLEERVTNLENLTLSYSEDTSIDYEKAVPADVGKPALVKMIGGATEKVVSKNIINPNNIAGHFIYPGLGETIVAPHTVNADGSISVTMDIKIGEYLDLFTNFGLSAGKYYYLVVGADVTNFTYALNITVYYRNSDNGTATVKIMAYKYEDSDTIEFTEAPEGTVFEPYHEPYFQHAEVERVESIGANLIPFPYDNGTKGAGYTETKNGITWTVNEDGSVTANGTATANTYIYLAQKLQLSVSSYYLSGTPTVSNNAYINSFIKESDGTSVKTVNDVGKGNLFTIADDSYYMDIRIYIGSGNTANNLIFKPMISRGTAAVPYKPYSAEPIDSITLPVEAIKAKEGVEDFGKGIDSTDYNYIECIDDKMYYVQTCKELVLTEAQSLYDYTYSGMKGARIASVLDANYDRAKAICTDTDKTTITDTSTNSMWLGVSNNKHIYWVGILDYLGLSTIDEFRTYLANRYANGNPVRIIYKLATPIITDITDLFTEGNKLQVQRGGAIRFVNERKMAIPNTIAFIKRKE